MAVAAAGLALLLALAGAAAAEERVVRTFGWDAAPAGTTRLEADGEGPARLRIEGPTEVRLLTLDEPGIGMPVYAVRGEVRTEDVVGPGYLELWSVFPDGNRYFSRTLSEIGLLRHLLGTEGWRTIAAPFSVLEADPVRPVRLEVNLVLPGAGTVELGPLELVELDEPSPFIPSHPTADAGPSSRALGLAAAAVGTVVGLLGALLGVRQSRRAQRSSPRP